MSKAKEFLEKKKAQAAAKKEKEESKKLVNIFFHSLDMYNLC